MDVLTLTHGDWLAEVSPLGAELMRLRHAELGELLWHGDARWWDPRAPILFPVTGRSIRGSVSVDGTAYAMPIHGFAKDCGFAVTQQTDSSCTLELADNVASRAHYPFAFRLSVTYALADSGLIVTATVANPGDEPLPASLGFHPGLLWPIAGLDRGDMAIDFGAREELTVRRADQGGFMLPEAENVALDDGKSWLTDELFAKGSLIVVSCGADDAVVYGAEGGPAVRVGWSNLPTLVIWTLPGAPFVCIEPWAGEPDAKEHAGDLRDRAGMRMIAPGGSERFTLTIGAVSSV